MRDNINLSLTKILGLGRYLPINKKENDRTQNRHKEASNIKAIDCPITEQRGNPAANYGPGNTDQNGNDKAAWIFTRVNCFGNRTCDESDDDPCDNAHFI